MRIGMINQKHDMIRQYFIDRAIQEAKKSHHKSRHGCIIFKGSRILSTGFNQLRHCSKLDKKYLKWVGSLHAEQATILFNQSDLKRSSLLVIRLNNMGQLMYSKPCKVCEALIRDVGITKIYYSGKGGVIQCL